MVFMCILLEKIDGYNGEETYSNFTLYNELLKLQIMYIERPTLIN